MESSDKQVSKNKDYILNVHIKIESKVMKYPMLCLSGAE